MRWQFSEDRLAGEEIIALVRQVVSEQSSDAEATAAVYRLEAYVRQMVRDEVALAAEPSEKIAAAVSHELSKLTSEVHRGLHDMSLAIWRKR